MTKRFKLIGDSNLEVLMQHHKHSRLPLKEAQSCQNGLEQLNI